MDRTTRRAVMIRVAVVATTLLVMLAIALTRGSGGAEAAVDRDRAQHTAVAAVLEAFEPSGSEHIGYSDVVDVSTARDYVVQTARLFLAGPSTSVTGTFEFASVPAVAAAEFHRMLGVDEGDWADKTSGEITLMLWHAEGDVFGGHVAGDTLVLLLDPVSGLETRAIVTYVQTRELRDSNSTLVKSELAVVR